MDMAAATKYWRQTLKEYESMKPMILPVDRKLSSNTVLTGNGLSVVFSLTTGVVKQLIHYASSVNATLYQVCLTIYSIFLYKLTGGQRDIIVGIVHANRYHPELCQMIGMFVNTLPMLIPIDPHDTFEQILSKVQTRIFQLQPYSNLPYQSIIDLLPKQRPNERNIIQTMFTFDEYQIPISQLAPTSIIQSYSIHNLNESSGLMGVPRVAPVMFEMELSMEYMVQTDSLRVNMMGSSDLFCSSTLIKMGRQFQLLVDQLFPSTSAVLLLITSSICDLSIILIEEMKQYESSCQIRQCFVEYAYDRPFATDDLELHSINRKFFHRFLIPFYIS